MNLSNLGFIKFELNETEIKFTKSLLPAAAA